MRIFLTIICLALTLGATPARAGTDYKCMNDCMAMGYLYGYCKSVCSYGEDYYFRMPRPQIRPMPQTDWGCVSDCTRMGYLWQYCKEACS